MKRVNDGLKVIIYIVFGLIFIISTYLIIINVHHYKALSYKITVSEADNNYKSFKDNVNNIESKLNNYLDNKKITPLKKTLNVLKDGGVFRLIPNSKITYDDLYQLNDYFMNNVINNLWVTDLKKINDIISFLVNNSEYLNSHFLDNGLTLYDSYSENTILNDYEMILKNFLSFSKVILSMIES